MESIKNHGQKYQKPSTSAVIGGVILGSMVKNAAVTPHKIIAPKIADKMVTLSKSLSSDEFSKVEQAITKTVKDSGLEAKGVSIIKATAENAEEIQNALTKELDKGLIKHLPEKIKNIAGSVISTPIEMGKNACYADKCKKIIMPEKELGLAIFHEAGHAMNANLSKFGRVLQKCRPMIALSVPIAMIALLKTKKAPGEEPKNGLDKATTFVKNNAGKLTFAAFVPMLLEEGLATIKGNNYAKKLLSPDLAKKVAKTNALGFSTYLLMATLSGVGIYLGTKVKDSVASRKLVSEAKQQ